MIAAAQKKETTRGSPPSGAGKPNSFCTLRNMKIRTVTLAAATAYIVDLLRWPVILLVVGLLLAVVYRFEPSRDGVEWRCIALGRGGRLAAMGLHLAPILLGRIWLGALDELYGSVSVMMASCYGYGSPLPSCLSGPNSMRAPTNKTTRFGSRSLSPQSRPIRRLSLAPARERFSVPCDAPA
jgi:hypothetical protein